MFLQLLQAQKWEIGRNLKIKQLQALSGMKAHHQMLASSCILGVKVIFFMYSLETSCIRIIWLGLAENPGS
jgi:hypothetical protein